MILISAGHHPTKPGACYEGFCEHDEALRWVDIICLQLGEIGLECLPVPAGILKNKVNFINARSPILAVEIHFNSAVSDGKHVGRGSETLYYPGSVKGKKAAEVMQKHLSKVFKPDRGAKEGYYQMNPNKGPDYFLEKTRCTALIVEPEFIHLKSDIVTKRGYGCEAITSAIKEVVHGSSTRT